LGLLRLGKTGRARDGPGAAEAIERAGRRQPTGGQDGGHRGGDRRVVGVAAQAGAGYALGDHTGLGGGTGTGPRHADASLLRGGVRYLQRANFLVHIQNRCRVKRYSESHETSDLRPFTFGHRKRAVANRATLLRGLRHAPSPDHPRQPQRRTCLPDSPLAGLRLPDGARCHPRLQQTWLGGLGGRILTSEANPSRL
jgi:hypothetical protein